MSVQHFLENRCPQAVTCVSADVLTTWGFHHASVQDNASAGGSSAIVCAAHIQSVIRAAWVQERSRKTGLAAVEVWIMKSKRERMMGAYRNAAANTKFRRHRLLSLPALDKLASRSSPSPGWAAMFDLTERKNQKKHRSQLRPGCLCKCWFPERY